jgi:hypothetical protein
MYFWSIHSRSTKFYEMFHFSIYFFIFKLKLVGWFFENKSKICIFPTKYFLLHTFFLTISRFFGLRTCRAKQQQKRATTNVYSVFSTDEVTGYFSAISANDRNQGAMIPVIRLAQSMRNTKRSKITECEGWLIHFTNHDDMVS